MSVKSTIKATSVALVVFGALGFYYFGRGGKLDTSQDRDILLHVEYEMVQKGKLDAYVAVFIGQGQRTSEYSKGSTWDDHMWIRPGEKVRLTSRIDGTGKLLCRITDQGRKIEDTAVSMKYFGEINCAVAVTG